MTEKNCGENKDLIAQVRTGNLSMTEYLAIMAGQMLEVNCRSKGRRRVDEWVDPEQAAREDAERKRKHPTHGYTRELPDGWTTTGRVEKPER
jgi:hypothetical protein